MSSKKRSPSSRSRKRMGHSVRRASIGDLAPMADIFRRVQGATPPFRTDLHTPMEDRGLLDNAIRKDAVWITEAGEAITGFLCLRQDTWIDHLYVEVDSQGRGHGSALIDAAKAHTDTLLLWCFLKNAPARRFYERRGFSLVRETDGSGNEEKEPDALLSWRRAASP